MAKFQVEQHDQEYVIYFCPGCKYNHSVPSKRWNWNKNVDKPTLSPSVRHFIPEHTDEDGTKTPERTICHYHIKAGIISYCDDCQHELKGKTVELPDI